MLLQHEKRLVSRNEFESINWDDISDVIDKEQFYKICHISKSTARYLLQSGKVPCKYIGKRTRCYKIKKEDVIDYLKDRKVLAESCSAPCRMGAAKNI
ncbi:MAG: helix-turn-helix domain-containing protein [Anaerovoracaceae bacterium]|uniref:helix-turn-helix domain-containing protein n=1 Tax=Ruminococcus bromii TaxID=40518 RepID=UPI003A2E8CB1